MMAHFRFELRLIRFLKLGILFFILTHALRAAAVSTEFVKNSEGISIQFRDIEIPQEKLSGPLRSGLSSTVLFHAKAWQDGQEKGSVSQTWKIHFDLWDDVYLVAIQENSESGGDSDKGDSPLKRVSHKTLNELFRSLANPQFFRIIPLRSISGTPRLKVELRVVVNPLSPESADRMKKWIAQKRVPGSSGLAESLGASAGGVDRSSKSAAAAVGGAASEGPRMTGLFNQILSRELEVAKQDALWSTQIAIESERWSSQ